MIGTSAFRWLLLGLACAASYLCLKRGFPPYLWLAALWSAVSAFYFATSGSRSRIAWFNAGAVILVLGAGEFYCWRTAPAGHLRTIGSPGDIVSHEFLGNAPRRSAVHAVRRYDDGALSFEVSYAIDSLGWRTTPAGGGSPADAAGVAFFGCSLAFGEGVPDSATLPAQMNRLSGGRVRAHNFGFSGYGPHQMLAILDHRLEAPALDRAPILGIYVAIPGHLYRVLGRTTWDPGPRYRLRKGGEVEFAGRFHTPIVARSLNVLYRSFLVSRLLEAWNQRLGPRDYELYFGVVSAARREFRARYPGSDLAVLYWDTRSTSPEALRLDRLLLERFASRGIRVIVASQVLDGYADQDRRYLLSAHDGHPNALAYRRLAEYLISDVISIPKLDPSPGATTQ